jgi:mRNA interferase MazF
MVTKLYVPDRGDLVWVDLNPTKGHEQANLRPALILSPKKYNEKTQLCIVCPVTSALKNYPFEVFLKGKKIEGVVLSDHVRNLDWKHRNVRFIEKVPQSVLKEVSNKLVVLIEG